MNYMLDTNIISYLIKNRDFKLINKFEQISENATICVSSITVAELFYGVKKRKNQKLEIAVRELLYPLEKVSFDENSALIYGDIRTELERNGEIIGSYDMLIAAHAKSIAAILVTNNMSEFKRVKNLKLENWVS